MPASLEGQLVVAISSRALFDFEEENKIFEQGDDRAYMKLQLDRLEEPARPGVAFSLVRKLLAFNDAQAQRVEVVILSRNDPVSGMRVFRSAQHYGLPIQRGSFTRGQSPWRYLRPLNANLFLSTHLSDVRSALDAGVPAAQVYPHSAHASEANPHEVRIAFDGDAVLFSDEADGPLDPEHKRMFMAMKREVLRLGGYACEFFVSQTSELTGMADRIIDLEGDSILPDRGRNPEQDGLAGQIHPDHPDLRRRDRH